MKPKKLSFVFTFTMLNEAHVKDHNFTHEEIMKIFSVIHDVNNFLGAMRRKYHERELGYKEFYVGIATNYEERLKEQHNVTDDFEIWDCETEFISREAERYYTDFKKTKGDCGGGDNPKYLYCYLIKDDTKE